MAAGFETALNDSNRLNVLNLPRDGFQTIPVKGNAVYKLIKPRKPKTRRPTKKRREM